MIEVKHEKRKVDGKIEFDILVDGKYKERVSRGVLIALNGTTPSHIASTCSVVGMVSAYYAFKDYVERNEECVKMMAEFEKFKESALPEIEKMLDELFAKTNKDRVEEED